MLYEGILSPWTTNKKLFSHFTESPSHHYPPFQRVFLSLQHPTTGWHNWGLNRRDLLQKYGHLGFRNKIRLGSHDHSWSLVSALQWLMKLSQHRTFYVCMGVDYTSFLDCTWSQQMGQKEKWLFLNELFFEQKSDHFFWFRMCGRSWWLAALIFREVIDTSPTHKDYQRIVVVF